MTARGWSRLSVWLLRQCCDGWKFTGTTPLFAEATSCSSRWRHMLASSTSYSWSKDTWVAACFSPEHRVNIEHRRGRPEPPVNQLGFDPFDATLATRQAGLVLQAVTTPHQEGAAFYMKPWE